MRNEKITVEELSEVLAQQLDGQDETRERILDGVRRYLRAADQDREERPERPPTRDVTIIVGSEEALGGIDPGQIYAYTVQMEDGEDHNRLVQHLLAKAAEYNSGCKRRARVRRLGGVFDTLKPKKHLGGFPKRIYTKEPALVVLTQNLPVPGQAAEGG